MKISWRGELPLWLLMGAMFALALVTWSHAPDQIPVSWGTNGQVDRYGGKFEGLLVLPFATLAIYGLTLVFPKLDPGRLNYPRFAGAFYVIRLATVALMAVMYGIFHLVMRGQHVDVERVMPLLIGAFFVVLGSVLGKIRPNWFVGIRTPWTLSSKAAWVRTNRLGGWVMVVAGFAIMTASLVRSQAYQIAAFVTLGVGLLWTVVFSYLVWRQDPDRVPPAGTLPGEENEGRTQGG